MGPGLLLSLIIQISDEDMLFQASWLFPVKEELSQLTWLHADHQHVLSVYGCWLAEFSLSTAAQPHFERAQIFHLAMDELCSKNHKVILEMLLQQVLTDIKGTCH